VLKDVVILGRIRVHEIENLYASIPISFMRRTSSCVFFGKFQSVLVFLAGFEIRETAILCALNL
jgi:hypothetical protein